MMSWLFLITIALLIKQYSLAKIQLFKKYNSNLKRSLAGTQIQ